MKKDAFYRVSMLCALFVLLFSNFCCIDVMGKTKKVVPNKQYEAKTIQVGAFDAVSVVGNCDVVFTPTTGEQSLELYASKNVIDLIEVYVENQNLIVRVKKGYNIWRNGDVMELRVSAPMVRQAIVTGSADFLFNQEVQVDKLTLSVTGSGEILTKALNTGHIECSIIGSGDILVQDLTAQKLIAKVTGSGDIKMAGSADEASLSVTGSGDIDAEAVRVKTIEASITGSGDIRCYPTEELNAHRSGSGTIYYKGNSVKVESKGIIKI